MKTTSLLGSKATVLPQRMISASTSPTDPTTVTRILYNNVSSPNFSISINLTVLLVPKSIASKVFSISMPSKHGLQMEKFKMLNGPPIYITVWIAPSPGIIPAQMRQKVFNTASQRLLLWITWKIGKEMEVVLVMTVISVIGLCRTKIVTCKSIEECLNRIVEDKNGWIS